MKLNSFKFQDGKVFWLPEYPEKPKEPPRHWAATSEWEEYEQKTLPNYTEAVAKSLALAIEVAPEDMQKVKRIIWWQHESLDPLTEDWPYDKGKVYSAECEMETHHEEIVRGQWVSSSKGIFEYMSKSKHPDEVRRFGRLKPKGVEIDDADLNLIIEHHRDRIKWHQSRIDYLQNDPAANSHDMKDELK